MNRGDLQRLVALRASQAREMAAKAKVARGLRRKPLEDEARQMAAAVDVAADILGEERDDHRAEERIKALFLHVFAVQSTAPGRRRKARPRILTVAPRPMEYDGIPENAGAPVRIPSDVPEDEARRIREADAAFLRGQATYEQKKLLMDASEDRHRRRMRGEDI
jgi:hypothetical protein